MQIPFNYVSDSETLKFVIPGWNIPWPQVPLFIGVLLFAAVVHEIGHMLAALSANVPVLSMGCVLITVYFGAYVELDTAALRKLQSCPIYSNLFLNFSS